MDEEAAPSTTAQQIKVLRAAAATLLLAAAAAIALIATGAFDPKPYGTLVAVEHPGPHTTHEAGETVSPLVVPWLVPSQRFSIRLTAAHAGGEADSVYGLAIGDGEERIVVAISPLGYVTVWEETTGAERVAHLPWQPWPHARPGIAGNEIWLDMGQDGDGATFTARVNRELLWHGELTFWPQDVNLYQTTFGGPATVDFRQVEWFAEP